MSDDVKPTPEFYTVVFKGDVRSITSNLFRFVTPFGEVIAIGIGNEFEVTDRLRAALARAEDSHV